MKIYITLIMMGLPEGTVQEMETVLVVPMALGKLLFAGWLIIRVIFGSEY